MIINRKVVGGGSGSHLEKYSRTFDFRNAVITEDLDLIFDRVTSCPSFAGVNATGKTIKIALPDSITSIGSIVNGLVADKFEVSANNLTQLSTTFVGSSLNVLKINGDLSKVTNFYETFDNCVITTIDADLDFSSCTSALRCLERNQALENVRFVPNAIQITMGINTYANRLTSESVISAANGIKDGINGTSLRLGVNKTKCNSIMGTVSTQIRTKTTVSEGSAVTDQSTFAAAVSDVKGTYVFTYDGTDWKDSDSNVVSLATYGITLTGTPAANDTITVDLYNFFTADESGTVTLTNFITNVKGWTLA